MSDYFHDNEFGENIFKLKYMQYNGETFEDRIRSVCSEISKIDNDAEYEDTWFKQIYVDNIWMPAGNILSSVGSGGRKVSVYNCTTIGIPEDTLESIAEARYKLLKYAAYRQGVGIDFSNLRPNGSKLSNSARVSSGSINWMIDFDVAANHVGQNGRAPAMLFSLKDSHPDLPEFINLKTSYDKITNANISVQASDEFMESVRRNDKWTMRFKTPHELVKKTANAHDLFIQICKNNLEFAEPGMQFIDTIKRFSNSDYVGHPVVSSNACSEKFLDPDGACNLCSINLETVPTDRVGMISFLGKHIPAIVRFMDNVITYEELNSFASKQQKISQSNLRRIGIGVTNLYAWILKGNKNTAGVVDLFRTIMYFAYKASRDLGIEKGSFPAFDRGKFEQSPNVQAAMKSGVVFDAMRNVELIAIAPTGTISMMFKKPVLSYGIEPPFGLYYWKRTRISGKYEYYFVVPSAVSDILKRDGIKLPIDRSIIKDDFNGSIGREVARIIDKHISLFRSIKTSREYLVDDKLSLLSAIAPYVDSAISTTFILPESANIDDVYNIYFRAWNMGIKSVTTYRDSSRYGIVEFVPFKDRAEWLLKNGKEINVSDLTDEERRSLGVFDKAKSGNGDDIAKIHKFVAEGGDKFYVIVSDSRIFIVNYKQENRTNDRLLSVANKLGKLVIAKDPEEFAKQISRSENTLNRFTRMLSACMKLDLLDDAIEIMNKYSIAGNLSWYLTKRVFYDRVSAVEKCQACGSEMSRTSDGCWECNSCGHSKCG